MASPLMSAIACEWIRSGSATLLLERQRREVEARQQIALEKLAGYQCASGSLHLWLTLPEPWQADEFVAAARARGVLVMGASTFAVGRVNLPHAVRVSVSAVAQRKQLIDGLDILAGLLREGPAASFSVM